jgi:hypothetical protein
VSFQNLQSTFLGNNQLILEEIMQQIGQLFLLRTNINSVGSVLDSPVGQSFNHGYLHILGLITPHTAGSFLGAFIHRLHFDLLLKFHYLARVILTFSRYTMQRGVTLKFHRE